MLLSCCNVEVARITPYYSVARITPPYLIVTRDLRTLIYLLNLELREECSRTLGPGMGWNPVCNRGAAVEADAIGRAAVQADVIGRRAAAEAGAIGEQQLDARRRPGTRLWKRMPQSGPGAAAEADAIGEKQLFRELSAPNYAR